MTMSFAVQFLLGVSILYLDSIENGCYGGCESIQAVLTRLIYLRGGLAGFIEKHSVDDVL